MNYFDQYTFIGSLPENGGQSNYCKHFQFKAIRLAILIKHYFSSRGNCLIRHIIKANY